MDAQRKPRLEQTPSAQTVQRRSDDEWHAVLQQHLAARRYGPLLRALAERAEVR